VKDSNGYVSPFQDRYTSKEMIGIFSRDRKYRVWRDRGLSTYALARAYKIPQRTDYNILDKISCELSNNCLKVA